MMSDTDGLSTAPGLLASSALLSGLSPRALRLQRRNLKKAQELQKLDETLWKLRPLPPFPSFSTPGPAKRTTSAISNRSWAKAARRKRNKERSRACKGDSRIRYGSGSLGIIRVSVRPRALAKRLAGKVYDDQKATIPRSEQLVLWTDASGDGSNKEGAVYGIGVTYKTSPLSDDWQYLPFSSTGGGVKGGIGTFEFCGLERALNYATKVIIGTTENENNENGSLAPEESEIGDKRLEDTVNADNKSAPIDGTHSNNEDLESTEYSDWGIMERLVKYLDEADRLLREQNNLGTPFLPNTRETPSSYLTDSGDKNTELHMTVLHESHPHPDNQDTKGKATLSGSLNGQINLSPSPKPSALSSSPSIKVVKIFCDCQEALGRVQNLLVPPDDRIRKAASTAPLRVQIAEADLVLHANSLLERGVNLEFHWVPGHEQIEGNTRADQVAKKARKAALDGKKYVGHVPLVTI